MNKTKNNILWTKGGGELMVKRLTTDVMSNRIN